MAVSAKADIRRFYRRHNEDQQLSCKCVFPSLFLLVCLYVAWNPFPLTPPPLHPHPFSVLGLNEGNLFNYVALLLIISVFAFSGVCSMEYTEHSPVAVSAEADVIPKKR